jgi:urease accessory protein UreE
MNNKEFIPQGTFVMVELPKHVMESKIVLTEDQKVAKRKTWLESGKELVVSMIGNDVRFVKEGDVIMANARGFITVDLDTEEPYFIIRESEIIGKFRG